RAGAAARAAPAATNARPLPLRTPGGSACVLPRSETLARGSARARAESDAAGARTRDSSSGRRPRFRPRPDSGSRHGHLRRPIVGSLPAGLLAAAPCDVAFVPEQRAFEPRGPVLVPFGGGRDEWPALELGAWLARAHGLPLKLLGIEANGSRRDASRMLASASLALQRFTGSVAEPAIVAAGVEGVLAEHGAVIVASLP